MGNHLDTSSNVSIRPKKFSRNDRIWQSKFEKEVNGNSFNERVGTDATDVFSTEAFTDKANEMKDRCHNSPGYNDSWAIRWNFDDAKDSEYISANYVNGFKLERKFIVTQAPVTMVNFLEMIWRNECRIIVALTEIYANNQHEYEPYWPTSLSTQTNGNYILTTTRIDTRNDYTKYFMEIENTSVAKRYSISLYHYTNWPEFCIPVNISKFLTFLLAVNADSLDRYFTQPDMGPIVVHGNADVVRTNTFCALDICIEEELATGQRNVFETVRRIRNEYRLSVVTRDQYKFIFHALKVLKKWDVLLKY